MNAKKRLLLFSVIVLLSGCLSTQKDDNRPLPTAKNVDIKRYLGQWYEIARLPMPNQDGCVQSRATYTLKEDKIFVENSCVEQNGKGRTVEGRLVLDDDEANHARWRVSFFRPFWGDYWILDVDEDYQSALIGQPSRRYMWILSRKPHMDEKRYEELVSKAEKLGFAVDNLILDHYDEDALQ